MTFSLCLALLVHFFVTLTHFVSIIIINNRDRLRFLKSGSSFRRFAERTVLREERESRPASERGPVLRKSKSEIPYVKSGIPFKSTTG